MSPPPHEHKLRLSKPLSARDDASRGAVRNPGTPLDLDWVRAIRVNRSAVERRAATIPTRRTVKKEWQAAWLLRAVTLIDLTTLSGDDTAGNVRRLCAKAIHPLRSDLEQALGVEALNVRAAAVCTTSAVNADSGGAPPGQPLTWMYWNPLYEKRAFQRSGAPSVSPARCSIVPIAPSPRITG